MLDSQYSWPWFSGMSHHLFCAMRRHKSMWVYCHIVGIDSTLKNVSQSSFVSSGHILYACVLSKQEHRTCLMPLWYKQNRQKLSSVFHTWICRHSEWNAFRWTNVAQKGGQIFTCIMLSWNCRNIKLSDHMKYTVNYIKSWKNFIFTWYQVNRWPKSSLV